MRKGFTLIEMSIVLVIIGLLVAGIVVAQSLIRTSRVQTVVTDVSTYQNAVAQFRQKYSVLPGDMPNATGYWGTNPNCATPGGVGTGTQTCNGNGDGQIETGAESFLVWQHLANAGFIAGQYSGAEYTPSPSAYMCGPSGFNCPGGKLAAAQAYWLIYSAPGGYMGGATTTFWNAPGAHYLLVGLNSGTGAPPKYPFLTAPEALSLDSKVDDGLPGTGLWRSFTANGVGQSDPNCVINGSTGLALTDGTIPSQPLGVYNVKYGNSNLACAFLIQMNF